MFINEYGDKNNPLFHFLYMSKIARCRYRGINSVHSLYQLRKPAGNKTSDEASSKILSAFFRYHLFRQILCR